uniref:Uncharacterized protein n=1 Tax=Arundo donax TaxID=35708 RepID=A0A0A9G755_ARUDO
MCLVSRGKKILTLLFVVQDCMVSPLSLAFEFQGSSRSY